MRPRRGKLEQAVCSLDGCARLFWRRGVDLRRSPRIFCSCACRNKAFSRGRAMRILACEAPGCMEIFTRLASEARRRCRHFCGRGCYMAVVDRVALGRAAAAAPVLRPAPPLVRYLRSQKGGQARARNLSPERLREIALLGVAARQAKGSKMVRRPRRALGWVDPVVPRRQPCG